jgi:hypothetical protein
MLARFLGALTLTIPLSITGASQTSPAVAGAQPAPPSPPDTPEVLKKANSGDASAQFELGKIYEAGGGVRQNLEQAAIWYRKAAEQGKPKIASAFCIG